VYDLIRVVEDRKMHVEPGINSARSTQRFPYCVTTTSKLPGSGQRNTPVVDRQGCLLLIEMLDEVIHIGLVLLKYSSLP